MPNYLFIYHSPAAPADAPQPSPEQMQQVLQQWGAWGEKMADRLVDFGNPLGEGVRVSPGGDTTPSQRQVSGYSMLRADSMEAAVELTGGHPHLDWPGAEIEVHEVQPVPGM